jgi:hypothetical protein
MAQAAVKDSPVLETLGFVWETIIVWEGFVLGHRFSDAENSNNEMPILGAVRSFCGAV